MIKRYRYTNVHILYTGFIELWHPYKAGLHEHALTHTPLRPNQVHISNNFPSFLGDRL